MRRLLDYNPDTGIREIFEGTDEGFNIHYEQDVEPILEANKAKQNLGKWGGANSACEFRHVADVPITIIYDWRRKYGVDFYDKNHWPAVRRLLNSNEYRYLKTAEIII